MEEELKSFIWNKIYIILFNNIILFMLIITISFIYTKGELI